MIYLSSFLFSDKSVINPNIYPYNVFANKTERLLLFDPITVLYGDNASGKSTVLNIMANKLGLEGLEYASSNQYGRVPYFMKFVEECSFPLGKRRTESRLAGFRLAAGISRAKIFCMRLRRYSRSRFW